jgi:hypothetical protein
MVRRKGDGAVVGPAGAAAERAGPGILARVTRTLVVGGAVWAAVTALAFLLLHPIIAAFIAIVGAVVVVIAVMTRDWERHPGFEERELARARRRAEKWERNKDARERDRRRWEAYQAKKAEQAAREDSP